MCHQVKTIAKNCDGQLSFCENCQVYHLTFNNLYIEFTARELESFKRYVSGIEVEYWEMKYERMVIKRKIPIQTMQQNLSMMFNKQELLSLKDLIMQKTQKPFENLSLLDIDYTFFLN
ncbi:hypothetical protein GCM10011344_45030 [Dokdonia pacifica]|uniref:Uncharacterized protein n=1 Tax=Dokdonia pacifica TaxID=1627892 RepID=A0A239CQ99_9FLAO|nr:DUF6686 family protein [Dokdonia pacifica]GGG39146.1 hypothetical protein GCM10011344_45030 [Dokdonia pacifica]SNS22310.1 hypothetical protein SAMN06265376_108133 [Dokdonia pacifica]